MNSESGYPGDRATAAALWFGAGGIVFLLGGAMAVSLGMAALFFGGLLYSAGAHRGETL